MKVYVYFESNEGDLTAECGGTSGVEVFGSARAAARHFIKKVADAESDGFVSDTESELLDGDEITLGSVLNGIRKRGYASVTMFFRKQNNWKSHFDCVVERKEIRKE